MEICHCREQIRIIDMEKYRKKKIEIMKNDFMIDLTPEEIDKINSLPTEYMVDHYCRELMKQRWSEEDENLEE